MSGWAWGTLAFCVFCFVIYAAPYVAAWVDKTLKKLGD